MDEKYNRTYPSPMITTMLCGKKPVTGQIPLANRNSSNALKLESDTNALEIAFSTISPPKSDVTSSFPMHIKLNLIDRNEGETSNYPITPVTPGNTANTGNDLSKKQRHNLREQRRILRISHQFSILRHKLEVAGYSLQKKDKFSVLQTTLEYISHLERNQIGGSRVTSQNNSHSITPSSSSESLAQNQSFLVDSMPSPVPALSMPSNMPNFPIDLDTSLFENGIAQNGAYRNAELLEGSTASYKDAFANSSMPSLLCKLDGTVLDANALFLELSFKNLDELRLHSLYTLCTQMDTPVMYKLVNRVLSCEVPTAQSKMLWRLSTSGDRKVFVSVSMIHDNMHRPANLHCSLLPLS